MSKLAVMGANGQVGAELCLLLAQLPEFTLVPVCRTRSGSAFLRAQGIAVRHGSCADAAAARSLLGDCALVVNSALATGSPAEIRATEDALITQALRASPADARVIHFSTQSVYGDPTPGRWIRWRNPYGRAKLGTERTALREAAAAGKDLYILRLGHVGGALQGISLDMRAALAAGEVLLPPRDVASNLVYTVTIVDAIRAIARGAVAPGTYDLMNVPQLSWRAVYEAERDIADLAQARIRSAPPAQVPRRRGLLRPMARLAAREAVRNTLAKLLARAPRRLNARAHAWWMRARARTEIAALARHDEVPGHLSWVPNGARFIEGLTPTLELLARRPYRELLQNGRAPWPQDLPPAFAQAPAPSPRFLSTAT
jgi:nucleoside-diphosphate-sugar epimerase